MGLTGSSVGIRASDRGLSVKKMYDDELVIALAGNPNVGKSTVFNGLTGMNQHTGNWSGKTVSSACGRCHTEDFRYVMVDIPGTYSLMAHSAEEEVARDFICFGEPDAVVLVCDATCLERNLNLVLQTIEVTDRVIVCVNLMDEAKRKGIHVDLSELSRCLGVPVVPCVARKKNSLGALLDAMDDVASGRWKETALPVSYPDDIEEEVRCLSEIIDGYGRAIGSRFAALRMIDGDDGIKDQIYSHIGADGERRTELDSAVEKARRALAERYGGDALRDAIVKAINDRAEEICRSSVTRKNSGYDKLDRRIDGILTGRVSGYFLMLLLLLFIFWLTVSGANYISDLLSMPLFAFEKVLTGFFGQIGAPEWLHGIVVLGAYRVLSWVVSVMLPPMAIFFPLFTLLEDVGYLPRIAYNLDAPFKRCNACGKQALCMAMGFGCNAAGVVGCRIIDSPRERLLAILTNNFVPCNGRFPFLIAIIGMFFVAGTEAVGASSVLSAAILTIFILLSIFVSLGATKLLSITLLRGIPSSFTLELPPYRKPQIGKVIVRSVFDRTLFVLGRAVAVAVPAGIVLWLAANITVGDATILAHLSDFLDPLGRLMGLDGVILIAFILGFPANEIVLPIIIMAYTAQGSLAELAGLSEIRALLVENGWTPLTAVCTMLFSLMHWPCSTTLITVWRETKSVKWTLLSAALPTAVGVASCIVLATVARVLGLV